MGGIERSDPKYSRREMLRLIGGSLTACAAGFGLPRQVLGRGNRPNIVFILSDDHRWDIMGHKGHPFIKTPNLDRLAKEGVSFHNSFVTTALCSPSRASFLTGRICPSPRG